MRKNSLIVSVTLVVLIVGGLSFAALQTRAASSSLRALLTSGGKTTWKGVVVYPGDTAPVVKKITATFTPVNAKRGTWTSSQYNIFDLTTVSGTRSRDSDTVSTSGSYSGSYRVVGNMVFAYEITAPNGITYSRPLTVLGELDGNRLFVYDVAGKNPMFSADLTRTQ